MAITGSNKEMALATHTIKELIENQSNDTIQLNELMRLAQQRCAAHQFTHKASIWKKIACRSILDMPVIGQSTGAVPSRKPAETSEERSAKQEATLVFVDGEWSSAESNVPAGITVDVQQGDAKDTVKSQWLEFLSAMPDYEITAALAVILAQSWVTVRVRKACKIRLKNIITQAHACALNLRIEIADTITVDCHDQIISTGVEQAQGLFYNRSLQLGKQAVLNDHFLNQVQSNTAVFCCQQVQIKQAGQYIFSHMATGGSVIRYYHQADLMDRHAACKFQGVALGADSQRHDQSLLVRHLDAQTESTQTFSHVARQKSLTNFSSRVYVCEGIQNIQSSQTNHNLLLDTSARALTAPELEIYSDEVQCAHGATVGAVNAKALFYLCSRGLTKSQAEALLVQGFIKERIMSFSPDVQPEAFKIAETYLDELGALA